MCGDVGELSEGGLSLAQEFGHSCAHALSDSPFWEGGSEAGGRFILEIGMPRPREDNYVVWWPVTRLLSRSSRNWKPKIAILSWVLCLTHHDSKIR